jgi:DNA-binding NarL/FixJ family response regulator
MKKLTPYQAQLLALAAEGLNDEAISRRMHTGHIAVRTSMHRIYQRLGVAAEDGLNCRVAAVLVYLKLKGLRV